MSTAIDDTPAQVAHAVDADDIADALAWLDTLAWPDDPDKAVYVQ